MRLVQFVTAKLSTSRIGILLENDKIIDCTQEGLSGSLVDVLNQENGFENLTSIASKALFSHQLSNVTLLAPITKPDKVLCVGMNYKELCKELKIPNPVHPMITSKFSSTIIGPFDNINKPTCTEALNWEVELVVVIGKKAKHVGIEDAFDYILGYTVGQDLTAMDLVDINSGQFLLPKTLDTFCPLGPCVVTKDEIPDPHNLKLSTRVNGVLKQSGATSGMVHRVDKIIAHISHYMTLYPGDVILTGTPSAVGYFKTPREALKVGDLVETEIENIGRLLNRVV